ncbi:MAG TPA: fructose-specific PTS transporter subunit EIIC [Acidiphilium sp.]|nr:fructose-specific PTS transporter subunit EIIC [Acidiphilium sp.]
MSVIVAVIAGGPGAVSRLLAAEALRRAALDAGHDIAIEIGGDDGVRDPLAAARIAAASLAIEIGPQAAGDPRFAGMRRYGATLDEVLADAGAVLRRALDSPPAGGRRIVAVTSCPTGIAHTFMAAEALLRAAAALGHEIRVETQGSVGAGTKLTGAEIAAADLVLIATDRQVDLARFAGKRVFHSGTKAAINDGKALIARALHEAAVQGGPARPESRAGAARARSGPYRHLMTGVSFMIPFVTAGGLLIALAFALGGIHATDAAAARSFAGALFEIGAKSAFTLFVPVLGGYIAYSIADRPGLAPGMIGGLLAALTGAGFLGAILAGFIGGYATRWLNETLRLPRGLQGLKPVLLLPVLGTLFTGLLMVYVIGRPVAELLHLMTHVLRSMQGSGALALGLLLGAMMAFDMGGPVNKAAYTFAVGLLSARVYTPMAAVMAAGMTPPLGVALATRLFASRFTTIERESGLPTAVLGLSFITEGAIPYAAEDPFRVIPCTMTGSAVAGAISMVADVKLRVPHGGVFVLPIPNAVTHLGLYVVAILAGSAVTALMLGLVKARLATPEG